MATNAPNYGGRSSRPAGSSKQLPQGTLVGVAKGGGVPARVPQHLAAVAKGGRSTTNTQPVR